MLRAETSAADVGPPSSYSSEPPAPSVAPQVAAPAAEEPAEANPLLGLLGAYDDDDDDDDELQASAAPHAAGESSVVDPASVPIAAMWQQCYDENSGGYYY